MANFDLGIKDVETHLQRSRAYLVGEDLSKNARRFGDEAAVQDDRGLTLTYQELDDRANRLATGLHDVGVDYGSGVALIAENRAEYLEAIYAAARLGAVLAPIHLRQERPELMHCVELADPDVAIISDKHDEKASWIREHDTIDPRIISLDDSAWGESYVDLLASGSTEHPDPSTAPSPEDGLISFFTSGTTGLPKGAIVSHRALFYRAMVWRLVTGVDAAYVAWSPMYHITPTVQIIGLGYVGGTHYPIDGFDIDLVFDRLEHVNPSYFAIMPGMCEDILEYASEHGYTAADFEGINYVGTMADLVAPEYMQRVTELFQAEWVNTFGTTETGPAPLTGNTIPIGMAPEKDDLSKIEGPLCRVALVDDEWNPVDTGERGELAVRGPTLFSGYVGNREANEADFDEGWFRTGDILIENEDGSYDFVDRRKYLIKSGGENIYPAEVERVLKDWSKVTEALLVRVPDETWGEVPKAYVSVSDGADIDPSDINDYLADRIARFQLPHYVEFVEEPKFPRNTTGKILRSEVEEWPVRSEERIRSPKSG